MVIHNYDIFKWMKKPQFKSDQYRKARGGYSRFLDVICEHCSTKVLIYQKDGPGELRRLYMDRIFAPEKLVSLQNNSLEKISDLTCPKCKRVLGIPYIYEKEKRKAFRLFVGAVKKKVTKL
jgi:hypothetical protein